MKNQLIIAVTTLVFLLIPFAFAQVPDVLWTRTFGGTSNDNCSSAQQTSDGGFIIFGSTESSGLGGVDAWLIKTDSLGNSLWTKTIGFNEIERCNDGQETFNGDLIFTGYTNSIGAGLYDVFLVRTDSFGDTLWTKTFGTSGYESGNAILQTPNGGGFVIAGETGATVTGQHDVYIIKTNSSGNLLWTQSIKGSDEDVAKDIRQNSNNEYLITGFTKSFGAGNSDVWLICVNSSGSILWNKTFGGPDEESGEAIVSTTDGGCAIAGYKYSDITNDIDVLLIRTNSSGDTLWTKTYGNADTIEAGYGLAKTDDGGFIITGTVATLFPLTQNLLVIRTDSLGNVIWTKTIEKDGYSTGYCIRKSNNNGFIICGEIYPTNRTDSDILAVYLDREQVTDVFEESATPLQGFELMQNYPNPFNPTTKISWQSPVSSHQSLKVYDVLGNEVATLVDEFREAGSYEVEFQSAVGNRQLASGVYFYRLQAGNYLETKKMILIK
ncbi:T9SS type A sorting domain-containing protein [Ignavibacterium album]|uniref:T9SS type A sorting domain-containing protein n=1 Tax=Ignavibacterium album TaxID=591197 RepID=UPI0026EEB239|nr:T9SS type A sorting domain-containing protein [Ignavibacterium album]